MMIFLLPKHARKMIDKLQHAFIWSGDGGENASNGCPLVNWLSACRPRGLEGLSVLDSQCFGERFASFDRDCNGLLRDDIGWLVPPI
jgi:hypothetical protein